MSADFFTDWMTLSFSEGILILCNGETEPEG